MTTTPTRRRAGRPFGSGGPKVAIRELPPQRWMARAACAGHDTRIWFSEDPDGAYRRARAICADCPVRGACLDWALDTNLDSGLWGGLNPDERRRIRRRRRAPHTIDLRDGAL